LSDPSDLDELDLDSPPPRPESADTEKILDQLIEVVESAKSMPLSSSAIIARDEVLGLLEAARESLPEELRRARYLLREREEFLTKARHDADELLEEARVQAERMVQRTEIVRQAEHRARRTIDDADADARRLRLEAEDFVDHKLGAFEIVLDRTLKTVKSGRERLAAIPYASGEPADEAPAPLGAEKGDGEDAFFDQDLQ
jgi:cell division septum initiation protein DivIVA